MDACLSITSFLPFLGLAILVVKLQKTVDMDSMIENLLAFIKHSHLRAKEITKVENEHSHHYLLLFHKEVRQNHSIVAFSLEFKFDIDSFLIKYKEWYTDHDAINESFVLEGITKFFQYIAEQVLIMGSQGYPELAHKLHQNRGAIYGERFGI
jgi:hypothetical protein